MKKDSRAPKVNVVIPMAGAGSRFAKAGYPLPKPFIDVKGKPMIARVMENLAIPDAHYILIARAEHVAEHRDLVEQLQKQYDCEFVLIDRLTQGTVATVLFARHRIANEIPMVIANSDQLVDDGLANMVRDCLERKLDGSIMTFELPDRDPKWSYARTNSEGLVEETKEKVAISDQATVGIYMFNKGSDFIEAAVDLMIHNDHTNGEWYVCPTYNYLIKRNKKIGIYPIARKGMHGLGTPEDLNAYLQRQAA